MSDYYIRQMGEKLAIPKTPRAEGLMIPAISIYSLESSGHNTTDGGGGEEEEEGEERKKFGRMKQEDPVFPMTSFGS